MELIFEISRQGRTATTIPLCDVPEVAVESCIDASLLRQAVDLPEVAEVDLVRHYTALSRRNFGVDIGFYPLGSCTMKYNPKINEDVARLPEFTAVHPLAPEAFAQGNLKLMYELKASLCEIFGMADFTLQPAAGAHGELTGIMVIKKYFEKKGEHRHKILIPDAAHGTNPASGALCGFETVTVKSNAEGGVDIDHLKSLMTEDVAGLMLTNPNTLGLFERNIEKVARIVHGKGGLLYCDGANANAYLGITRPGDLGFDLIQLNLHKTFSTPHGCGGPGSGPLGVGKKLVPYLPVPAHCQKARALQPGCRLPRHDRSREGLLRKLQCHGQGLDLYPVARRGRPEARERDRGAQCQLCEGTPETPLRSALRPGLHARMRLLRKPSGPRKRRAYLRYREAPARLRLSSAHDLLPAHRARGDHDRAERDREQGTLDAFCDAMIAIAGEAKDTPEMVKSAPLSTPVGRMDEVKAAREPDVCFRGCGC